MKTYPLFLVHLHEARCVVVGGGEVAARKVGALLEAGAEVTVIAPEFSERLQGLASTGEVHLLRRGFESGDLVGAFLAIAATDDAEINERVWQEARARQMLVNVVDDPERCNFIAPSVVRRGPLTLAISTSGRCPALSRHLRQQLECDFGPAYGHYAELLGELREKTVTRLSFAERRNFWEHIFRSEVLALLTSGDRQGARRVAWDILEQHTSGGP